MSKLDPLLSPRPPWLARYPARLIGKIGRHPGSEFQNWSAPCFRRIYPETDVVAELRRAKARKNVTARAESVAPSSLFLSTITEPELELGVLFIERRDHSQGEPQRPRWFTA
ncbi:MAG: hypothetical protein CMLOHMNK_00371 [Steroidobacteraceae bacterium]|nr:hypothetical protein [Steroidobacteraceae bacterium]